MLGKQSLLWRRNMRLHCVLCLCTRLPPIDNNQGSSSERSDYCFTMPWSWQANVCCPQVIKNDPNLSPWPTDMKQYKTEVKRQGDKQRLVQTILQSCDCKHQYVIFVRANETVRQLQKLVRRLSACEETNASSIAEVILDHWIVLWILAVSYYCVDWQVLKTITHQQSRTAAKSSHLLVICRKAKYCKLMN